MLIKAEVYAISRGIEPSASGKFRYTFLQGYYEGKPLESFLSEPTLQTIFTPQVLKFAPFQPVVAMIDISQYNPNEPVSIRVTSVIDPETGTVVYDKGEDKRQEAAYNAAHPQQAVAQTAEQSTPQTFVRKRQGGK